MSTDWLGSASPYVRAKREEEHGPHYLACARVAVKDCPAKLPIKWIEQQEHNQKLPSCCRHPENHDVVALFSSKRDKDLGVPDIYLLICKEQHDFKDKQGNVIGTGEAHHRKFCVGGGTRPGWDIR